MPGGADPVGGGVWATYERRGTLLQGAAEGTGAVQGVWGGDGVWIIGGTHEDTTWASNRGDMDMENLDHGGRTADVTHDLTDQGRPTEMPGGGIPRTSGDEDGNAGTFYAPECTGKYGHFGGEKPPPPTVPLVRHTGHLMYTEQKAPCHRTVRQGSGSEEKEVSGGGIEGEHGEGLSGLWRTFGNVIAFIYLGRVMTAGDVDWPVVVGKLQKAMKSWGRLFWILIQEGADLKVLRNFSRQ